MKMPRKPPHTADLIAEANESGRLPAVIDVVSKPAEFRKYLHWDKLRYYTPPGGLSQEEWWLAIKLDRQSQYRNLPLTDAAGKPFRYLLPDPVPERLHNIDLRLGGSIGTSGPFTNPDTKNQYLIRSLVDEAITSSQLEGAATTRLVAKEMIRSKRKPRDHGERMILNNYRTMQRIGALRDKSLTPEIVFEIQRTVTVGTLKNADAAGRLRRTDEPVVVDDYKGEVFHVPPPAEGLTARMAAMCEFANGSGSGGFVHPAVRSIILHFWLAYDHPFVDGNGRTARALFYWSMLHHGFWLCEFVSISEILLKAPARYGRAFLHTETDDNDLTYFLLHQLDVLRRATKQLHEFVARKTEQLRAAERELRGVVVLNHRQRAIVAHALRHPGFRYTIESHRSSHGVVHQTARSDLHDLVRRELLDAVKVGRVWYFTAKPDLERKLAEMP